MATRVFRPTYTGKGTPDARQSRTHHIAFRDHLHRRQTLAGFPDKRKTETLALRVENLVRCRAGGEPIGDDLSRWLHGLDDARRARLASMDLVTAAMAYGDLPLIAHLEGQIDTAGIVTEPGYQQSLAAKGNTPIHVTKTISRAKKIIEGCGFITWRDLASPGAVTRVEVLLGQWRTDGAIGGRTLNYYVRDFGSFCRWLKSTGRIPAEVMTGLTGPEVMTGLTGVKNEEIETDARRPLQIDELQYLLPVVKTAEPVLGLSGDERAILYRFAFETGLRPGQIRSLKVADFNLDAEYPTVTGHARFVKRRKAHTQMLRPALAAELQERFVTKLPTAAAFRLPTEYRLADMLRRDMATARAAWINEAATAKVRGERQRSDFLAEKNHEGERAVFYSMRHGHGTALGAAGVPEKDIAASMHHASRTTTARYLHAGRRAVAAAVALLPDLSSATEKLCARVVGGVDTLRRPCATGTTSVESSGDRGGSKRSIAAKKRI